MGIYLSETDRLSYTYLIGWSKLDKWYYGRRTAKGCSPDDLWVTYFTSSVYVSEFREKNGEPDIIQVRKTFKSSYLCKRCENRVLLKLKAAKDDRWLNRTNGDLNFDVTGRVTVKDAMGNTRSVSVDDPRYISGELVHNHSGMVTVIDPITKETEKIYVDDPRFLSGELVHINNGIKHSRPREIVTCPHCGTVGKTSGMGRHHFDRCPVVTGIPRRHPRKTCPHCGMECAATNAKRWHFDNCRKKNENKS